MFLQKRSSGIYEKASQRIVACKKINRNFDFGNGLTRYNYQAAIDKVKAAMDDYHKHLGIIDGKLNCLIDKEYELRCWNERILAGIAACISKQVTYQKANTKTYNKTNNKKAVKQV